MKIFLTFLLAFSCIAFCTADYSWTQWFDRNSPTLRNNEDNEMLYWIRRENPGKVCSRPFAIEAQLVDGRHYTESGNKITMSPRYGLRCRGAFQRGKRCKDFKVRFLCKTGLCPVAKWTPWLNRDGPSGYQDHEVFRTFKNERKNEVKDCIPIATDVRLADGTDAAQSGNKVHMSASTGFYCVNRENSRYNQCKDFKVRFLCLPESYNPTRPPFVIKTLPWTINPKPWTIHSKFTLLPTFSPITKFTPITRIPPRYPSLNKLPWHRW